MIITSVVAQDSQGKHHVFIELFHAQHHFSTVGKIAQRTSVKKYFYHPTTPVNLDIILKKYEGYKEV